MRRASLAAFIALVLATGLLSGTASGSTPWFRYYRGTTPEGAIVRIEVGVSTEGVALLRSLLATPAWAVRGGRCTIVGTAGDDDLKGTRHDDVICALAGNDRVDGRGGNDMVFLGPGNDDFVGGPGDDVIHGGGDGDFLNNGGGSDRLYGGGGGDTMWDWHGMDVLSGGADNDCMNAADHDAGDVIRGGRGRDRFAADDRDEVFSAEVPRWCVG